MKVRMLRTIVATLALAVFAAALAPAPAAASAQLTEAKQCRKTFTKQGKTYAKKRLKLMLGCIDKLLACEIYSEVDLTNQNGCRSKAEDSCNARLGSSSDTTLSRTRAAFDTKAGLGCLGFGITEMLSTSSGGLWFANDPDCGSSVDIPTLVDCVREEVEEEVDGMIAQVKPRAALLLNNMGLSDEFPNLPLPPTVTVVISATGAGSGVLVNPGTINVPVGSALRIEGDPNLSCGGGASNGRLDVTVGTQTVQIKEPWGPSISALLGPFTATGTLTYEIDLKDSSCMDSTSGDVDVVP